ncbi:MAG: hypothetical protein ACR2QZ_11275 [Woeseiaceae bacterium]
MNKMGGRQAVQSNERTFFTGMAVAIAVIVLIGFARTFFLRALFPDAQSFAAPEPIFLFHGVVFAAWTGFLVLQALLIRRHRVSLHRSVGWLGVALAVLMVAIGTYGSLVAAARPGGFIGVPLPPQQFLIFPLFDMVLFGLFVTLAITTRADPQSHKRLMILATINLVEAAIIRIPLAFIAAGAPFTSRGLSYLFIIAMVVWDVRSRGKIHRSTLWGGILIVISLPLRMMVSQTRLWNDVANWLIQLV